VNIGVNMLLWTGHVTEQHFPLFESIKAWGFDGIEIPVLTLAPLAHYEHIGAAARDCGLQITTVSAFTGDVDPLADDWIEAADYLMRVIERVHALSSRLLVGPLYQVLGKFSGSPPTELELQRIAELHRLVGAAAEAAGIECALEPLNRFEAHLLNTVEQTIAYLSALDVPAIGGMYDTFHAHIEEKDPLQALSVMHRSGWLRHVHIAENDRGTPGHGHAKLRDTIRSLRDVGYGGWLTIEAFGTGVPELTAATRVWRPFFSDRESVCRDGYRFIRDTWDGEAA
jgi:D-psicose/D-tagatose/L-ribulose 3-epimerase